MIAVLSMKEDCSMKRTRRYPPTKTQAEIRRLQKGWIRWMGQEEFDLFVTLNFNTDANYRRLRSAFRALLARLDRHFLGRGWCKVPSPMRTKAVAVVENLDTNSHIHVLMTLPRRGRKLSIHEQRQIVGDYWSILVPSGSANVKEIYDAKPLIRYFAKQFKRPGYFEMFMLSTEFHNT
jgi:hypothetical protein